MARTSPAPWNVDRSGIWAARAMRRAALVAVLCLSTATAAPLLANALPPVPCDETATLTLADAPGAATVGFGDGAYQDGDLPALWFPDGAVLMGDTTGHAPGGVVDEAFLAISVLFPQSIAQNVVVDPEAVLGWDLGFADRDGDGLWGPQEELFLSPGRSVAPEALRLDGGIRRASVALHGLALTAAEAPLVILDEDADGTVTAGDRAFLDMDNSSNVTVGDLELPTGARVPAGSADLGRPGFVRAWRAAYQDRFAPGARGGAATASQVEVNISSAWDGQRLGLVAWDASGYAEAVAWPVACRVDEETQTQPVTAGRPLETGWSDQALIGSTFGVAALVGASTAGLQRLRRPRILQKAVDVRVTQWSVTADVEEAQADGATLRAGGRPEPLPGPMRDLLQASLAGDDAARQELSQALLDHLERPHPDAAVGISWDAVTTTVEIEAEVRWGGVRRDVAWSQSGNTQAWELRWDLPDPLDLESVRESLDDFCERARMPIEQVAIRGQ